MDDAIRAAARSFETGKRRKFLSTQRIILAPSRYFLSGSIDSPRGTPPVQACGPAQNLYSTPAWKTPMPAVTIRAVIATSAKNSAMRGWPSAATESRPAAIATMCG